MSPCRSDTGPIYSITGAADDGAALCSARPSASTTITRSCRLFGSTEKTAYASADRSRLWLAKRSLSTAPAVGRGAGAFTGGEPVEKRAVGGRSLVGICTVEIGPASDNVMPQGRFP